MNQLNELRDRYDWPLKPLGAVVGVFLVLAGLGTIVGAPWATSISAAVGIVQVVGALLMAALGVGLVYLSVLGDRER